METTSKQHQHEKDCADTAGWLNPLFVLQSSQQYLCHLCSNRLCCTSKRHVAEDSMRQSVPQPVRSSAHSDLAVTQAVLSVSAHKETQGSLAIMQIMCC